MKNELCQAISERKIITFLYKDGPRTVEPHMVAYTKTDQLCLSAWFLHGASDSQEGPGWRMYLLDEMSNLTASNQHFLSARPGYQPDGGKVFHDVQCSL